jgi:hypothetical protein
MSSFSETFNAGMVGLALVYAEHYEKNGRTFINLFLTAKSVRTGSEMAVRCAKKIGVFDEAYNTGKDFSDYAYRFVGLTESDKALLADILLLIYYINHEKTHQPEG